MFTNISWSEYSIFILISVFIYYIIILVIFYKGEIVNRVENLQLQHKRLIKYNPSDSEEIESDLNSVSIDYANEIIKLQEEIQSQLQRAKSKKSIKEEIIMSLQLVLQNYPAIKESSNKDFINNYIKEVLENLCSIHFDEKEID